MSYYKIILPCRTVTNRSTSRLHERLQRARPSSISVQVSRLPQVDVALRRLPRRNVRPWVAAVEEIFDVRVAVAVEIAGRVGRVVGVETEFRFPRVRHAVGVGVGVGLALVIREAGFGRPSRGEGVWAW